MLDSAVFAQPLPAVIALFIVVGAAYLGARLAVLYFGKDLRLVEQLSGYVVVILFIGFLSDLFLHGIISKYFLNATAIILGSFGCIQIWKVIRSWHVALPSFLDLNTQQLCQVFIAASILTLLLLLALAPPTDADSLDYHLGVPLVWLNEGGYQPLNSWFVARLTGLGERVILFGLANGTDVLSALLQWSGLVIAIVSIHEFSSSRSRDDLILAALLVLSAPVITFLVLNQKPYLFPVSSIALGISLLLTNRKAIAYKKRLPVGLLLIISAMLYKYSFLLTLSGISFLLIYHSSKESAFGRLVTVGVVLALLLLSPYYFRNFYYFHDPFSPLLSKYIDGTEPVLVNFSDYLRIGYYPSFRNIIRIPIEQGIITLSPAKISTVMGLGGAGILVAFFSKRSKALLIMLSFSTIFILIVLLGRPVSRFMFDLYLVGCMGFLLSEFDRFKLMFSNVLAVQSILVLAICLYSLYTIFPGIFSESARKEMMMAKANGYEPAQLLGRVLPEDAVLLTNLRSKILIPRKVVFADSIEYARNQADTNRLIRQEDQSYEITHIALNHPVQDRYSSLFACSRSDLMTLHEIGYATRNPFNNRKKKLLVFELDRSQEGCFLNN